MCGCGRHCRHSSYSSTSYTIAVVRWAWRAAPRTMFNRRRSARSVPISLGVLECVSTLSEKHSEPSPRALGDGRARESGECGQGADENEFIRSALFSVPSCAHTNGIATYPETNAESHNAVAQNARNVLNGASRSRSATSISVRFFIACEIEACRRARSGRESH